MLSQLMLTLPISTPSEFLDTLQPRLPGPCGGGAPGGGVAGVHEAEAEEAQVVQEDLEDQ